MKNTIEISPSGTKWVEEKTLYEFFTPHSMLRIRSYNLEEYSVHEGKVESSLWRISWYGINNFTYRKDTREGVSFWGFSLFFSGEAPKIIISLKERRPFPRANTFGFLHTDSQGEEFYRVQNNILSSSRLVPINVIEVSGYTNLSQIYSLLKDRLEEIAKQEHAHLENLAKNEIIRKQQERDYFQRIKKLEDIQKINPIQFEKLIFALFKRMGYDVLLTKASRDEGIDLILSKNGKKSVVQCKRYSGTVGQPIARDLYGSMIHNRAEDAYLITTGVFSLPAQTWASGKPIHLVDGKMLVEWLETILDKDEIG